MPCEIGGLQYASRVFVRTVDVAACRSNASSIQVCVRLLISGFDCPVEQLKRLPGIPIVVAKRGEIEQDFSVARMSLLDLLESLIHQ